MASEQRDNRAEFVAAVMAASEAGTLELEDIKYGRRTKVKLVKSFCGYGCRADRFADRNRITNAFGFPESRGSHQWSVDDETGGVYLANVLAYYGSSEWLLIDGKRLPLHSDLEVNGRGYMSLRPVHAESQWRERGILTDATDRVLASATLAVGDTVEVTGLDIAGGQCEPIGAVGTLYHLCEEGWWAVEFGDERGDWAFPAESLRRVPPAEQPAPPSRAQQIETAVTRRDREEFQAWAYRMCKAHQAAAAVPPDATAADVHDVILQALGGSNG